MAREVPGLDHLDPVHDVHALDDLTEDRVAVAIGLGVIEIVIVIHVDKKLGRRRIGIGGAGHGDGALVIPETVLGLVDDGRPGLLLLHAFGESPALDHEAVDDPVEDGAVVELVIHVGKEVLHRHRRLLLVKLDLQSPQVRFHDHHRIGGEGRKSEECQREKKCAHKLSLEEFLLV